MATNKAFLVSVQERSTKKVFDYFDVQASGEWAAKSIVRQQIQHEQKYTKKWAKLDNVDWWLDAVEV